MAKHIMTVVLKGFGSNPECELSEGNGLYADGTIDVTTATATVGSFLANLRAKSDADYETAGVDVDAFLSRPKHRALKSAPLSVFVDGIIALRRGKALVAFMAENPDSDPADASDAIQALPGCTKADADRLTEILPGYFRSNADRFHMGRRAGISVRYVPGEVQKDAKGETVYDGQGKPVPGTRWTDEEWTRMVNASKKEDSATA